MKKILLFLFVLLLFDLNAQTKMKPITELINTNDSAWPLIQEWVSTAKNKIEILPVDSIKSKEALYNTQVTTRSPMGAIVYHTGGIFVDNGWIRILGAGNEERFNRSLPDWNKGKTFMEFGEAPLSLMVADDALGGLFILNGGAFADDLGKLYYLAPDNLEIQPLGISYTEFLQFCFNGDLVDFYADLRWDNWQQEVSKINGDEVFSFYPYLFTKEGKDINKNHRAVIQMNEHYKFISELNKDTQ